MHSGCIPEEGAHVPRTKAIERFDVSDTEIFHPPQYSPSDDVVDLTEVSDDDDDLILVRFVLALQPQSFEYVTAFCNIGLVVGLPCRRSLRLSTQCLLSSLFSSTGPLRPPNGNAGPSGAWRRGGGGAAGRGRLLQGGGVPLSLLRTPVLAPVAAPPVGSPTGSLSCPVCMEKMHEPSCGPCGCVPCGSFLAPW